jgi:hypothetical protein
MSVGTFGIEKEFLAALPQPALLSKVLPDRTDTVWPVGGLG